jgi:hypothetical protein
MGGVLGDAGYGDETAFRDGITHCIRHALCGGYSPGHHGVGASDCATTTQSLVRLRHAARETVAGAKQLASGREGTGHAIARASLAHCHPAGGVPITNSLPVSRGTSGSRAPELPQARDASRGVAADRMARR